MNDREEVKKIVSELIQSTENVLEKKPFFFVTEFDLQAFLYSQLIDTPESSNPFRMDRDSKTVDCFRVHGEYIDTEFRTKKSNKMEAMI